MEVGIVAEADDVVVDGVALHLVVEVGKGRIAGIIFLEGGVGRDAFGVQNDFGSEAHFPAGGCSPAKQGSETIPVGGRGGGIAILGIAGISSPVHAITDFVARLYEVGGGPGLGQCGECVLGVVVNRVLQVAL